MKNDLTKEEYLKHVERGDSKQVADITKLQRLNHGKGYSVAYVDNVIKMKKRTSDAPFENEDIWDIFKDLIKARLFTKYFAEHQGMNVDSIEKEVQNFHKNNKGLWSKVVEHYSK